MNDISKLVVIGASAGGLQAIAELVSNFPESPNVAVLVVLHISKQSMAEVISHHIQKHTYLTCRVPVNEEKIMPGHLYIAPPDHHMLVKKGKILINNGPHENRWRPSIDVLFRSAAVAYSSSVIGIILTGLLDDGTSGMGAIKRSGGTCIVQEPREAEFSDMPTNVLNNVDVDYRVPIADMGYILQDLFSMPSTAPSSIPYEIQVEADITERLTISMDSLSKISSHSLLTCPDCGGGLWKMKDNAVHRYRCHTGHVYSEKTLLQVQSEDIEEALWIAIRLLEERKSLLRTAAGHAKDAGLITESSDKQARSEEVITHIERLKRALQLISLNEPND